MHFTLLQSGIILSSFLLSLVSILLWYKRDQISNQKQTEFLPTLISVFYWSAFLSLLMKIFLDLFFIWGEAWTLITSPYLNYFAIFLEEIIKATSIVIGLEMADKKFNEISDGIVFAAMSAFGFIFFENIIFLWEIDNEAEIVTTFLGRNIFSYSAHLLSAIVFGFFYASAYLSSVLIRPKKHKPYALLSAIRESARKYRLENHSATQILRHYLAVLAKIFSLHIIIFHILLHRKTRGHWSGELIMEGFLLAFYLHLFYDFILSTNHRELSAIFLSLYVIFPLVLFINFSHFEKNKNLLKK